METSIVESISKDEYLYDSNCLAKAIELRYKAALRVEVCKAHKASGNFLFQSTQEVDKDIARFQRIYDRINFYCKNKAIKILADTQ